MQIELTPCTKQDIEIIYHFSKQLIDTYEDKENIDYEKVLQWILHKINNQINEYKRIISNQNHVGYIHIIDGEQIELDDLYIFENHQNQGIATKLINTIVHTSNKTIFLYVFIKNIRAISLYKKCGFQITKKIQNSRYIMTYFHPNQL